MHTSSAHTTHKQSANQSKPFVIGICGGSGSGKTTLLERLEKQFRQESVVKLSLDNYYLPIEEQKLDSKGKVNFDLPTALDENRINEDLNRLISGKSITITEYDFNVDRDAAPKTVEINSGNVIIVEGLFVFHYTQVEKMIDFGIFVDVSDDIQLERRMKRDMSERGYSKEDISYQWVNHVKPCFDKYLAPYRENADFRFNNSAEFEVEFNRLAEVLEHAMRINDKDKASH